MGEIYCITNKLTGKKYVGQTIQGIKERYRQHWKVSKTLDTPLYRAFRKYGPENFEIETLETCENERLDEREIFWIKTLETCGEKGYNCNGGGIGGSFSNFHDVEIIGERYLQGERLDKLCKEFHHDYTVIRRELGEIGIEVNTFAGPQKLSKRVAAINPLTKEVVKIYNSQSEAARDLCPEGHNYKAISNHISKARDTERIAHGFLWKSF